MTTIGYSGGASGSPKPLGEIFVIESHLLSTRSADMYRALDKRRGSGACLWMLRHPLAAKSDAVKRFLGRMEMIREFDPPLVELLDYGVDSAGVAFASIPSLDGHPVVSGNVELQEAERRFISCVRAVERLHGQGAVCGDICGSSFWVDRAGDVRLIGLMGSFDSEAAATAMLPPMETLPYVAPEQRGGGGLEQASDVFALGVLGYFLFTGKHPYGEGPGALMGDFDISRVKPISSFLSVPPPWAEEVIMKCLAPNPGDRFGSAGEIYHTIVQARERIFSRESAPTRTRSDATPKTRSKSGAEEMPIRAQAIKSSVPVAQESSPKDSSGRRKTMRLAVMGLAAIVVGVVLAQVIISRKPKEVSPLQEELAAHREVVSKDLVDVIDSIQGADTELNDRAAQLDKIVNSDDPIAHDILVKSAKDAKTQQLRSLSEKAIIDRARRLGLMRSCEQVRQWLRSLKNDELPSIYEAVLQSLDTTLPVDARASLLRQAYASNPRMVLKLAAALTIDTGKFDEYQPILAQLVADSMKLDDAAQYSALALVLANSELAMMFGDDIVQRREQIPDKDVLWLLKMLAERNDVNVRAIANLALERNIVPQLQSIFLTMIRDRSDLTPDLLTALIRSAAGVPRMVDVAAFGRWYDVDAERTLLALCALGGDAAILTEAFDTLAGKSLSIEPSASMVEWVRKNYWDKRAEFARAVGVMSYLTVVDPAEVRLVLSGLDRYAKDPALIDILLDSKSPVVARLVVERYSKMIGLGGLLNLLSYPDKEVRVLAIKELKDYNDIGALKFIIDNYEREKDPEVKQVYKDSFWVIKEREAKGGL